jgi:hypothetical protein
MNRHWPAGLVAVFALGLACAAGHRPQLAYFTKTVLTKWVDNGTKIRNLQFFLDDPLELEGVIESESAVVGEFHELVVRKKVLIDHVAFPARTRGTVIDIDPDYDEILPKIKLFFKMDVTRTLWVCFEGNNEKILPFSPDASGSYVLKEKKPGSRKVYYGGKEYTIINRGRLNGLLYDLDYDEELQRQNRKQVDGRGFN